MKNILLSLFAICLTSCLMSCSVPKNGVAQREEAKGNAGDSAQVIYSDSIDRIVREARTAVLYDMANLVTEDSLSEKHDSLLCFSIEKKVGVVKKGQLDVLRFILTDSKMYVKKYAPIRQPFMPNVGIEIKNKRQKVYVFPSFGTHEIAIADEKGNFRYYLMRESRLMERWVSQYFPNDPYYELLLNYEYDEKN